MNTTDVSKALVPGDGGIGLFDGWQVTCSFTDAEMTELLAAYDPASSTSPSVTVCRPIVRAMLDAVLAYQPQET